MHDIMENRVYYGEYSLKHWIELILKENIILPDYQRYFVWSEGKVETLIETLKKKQFVPPVTIGAFKNGEQNRNLIIDGQQRLTSLLLSYLGLYPDEATYKKKIELLANENDNNEDAEEEQLDNVMEWTFKKLTKKGNSKDEILANITNGNYKVIDFQINDRFLETTFLGFSYLVPSATSLTEKQKYYSSVFRNVNIQGEVLLPQESRKSLYFLNESFSHFFDPGFHNIKIKTPYNEAQLDFVRYLSLLSQYFKDQNGNRVARGYKLKMEKFYEEYIYSIVGESISPLFAEFQSIFPNGQYSERIARLKSTIASLEIPQIYLSIIDLDLYFFGLIYEIVFLNKEIDDTQKSALNAEIATKITTFKQDQSHTRAPSALKYLRARMEASIEIYNKYAR